MNYDFEQDRKVISQSTLDPAKTSHMQLYTRDGKLQGTLNDMLSSEDLHSLYKDEGNYEF
jgi:hypothetical protein